MAGTKPYMGECSRPLRPQSSSPATSHPSLTLPPTPTPDPSHALSRLWPLPKPSALPERPPPLFSRECLLGQKGWLSSVQFSHSVMSDSLQPHEPQHARSPYPSPTPRVHPNPCPLSWWCHPTISSPVVPFSSCPQSFPAPGSFQMSQLFASGGPVLEFQFSISPSNEHPGLISFRMDWLDFLPVQGTLKSLF